MRPSTTARVVAAGVSLIAVTSVVSACAVGAGAPEPAPADPVTAVGAPASVLAEAQPVQADPRVGAVFLGDGDLHMCSGAVLASPSMDLILTAAHCLAADVDARFTPGYDDDDAAPSWQVDAVYLDPRWIADQDPMADYAVARVSRPDGALLSSVAGGGLRVGRAPTSGEAVTVIGYPAGVGGGPSACRAPAGVEVQGFSELHCDGVVGGFSGAPWISGSTVSGVIGGLDGGGCAEEVSYSPPFDDALVALVSRAEAGDVPDEAPAFFDDGCA